MITAKAQQDCLVCRIRPAPREDALTALPLCLPLGYNQAYELVLSALLCRAAQESYLSFDLDGGLSSILSSRILASRVLEEAIWYGELKLID